MSSWACTCLIWWGFVFSLKAEGVCACGLACRLCRPALFLRRSGLNTCSTLMRFIEGTFLFVGCAVTCCFYSWRNSSVSADSSRLTRHCPPWVVGEAARGTMAFSWYCHWMGKQVSELHQCHCCHALPGIIHRAALFRSAPCLCIHHCCRVLLDGSSYTRIMLR